MSSKPERVAHAVPNGSVIASNNSWLVINERLIVARERPVLHASVAFPQRMFAAFGAYAKRMVCPSQVVDECQAHPTMSSGKLLVTTRTKSPARGVTPFATRA